MPYADKKSPAAIKSRRTASKRFYEKNRKQEAARSAAWNKANKDRVNATSRERRSKRMEPRKVLWWNARNRAKANGIAFDLRIEDIVVPETCPVLGIPLVIANGFARDGSPSIDRIDPSKGYVLGNIAIISHKANTIKSNASCSELRCVLAYMEQASDR